MSLLIRKTSIELVAIAKAIKDARVLGVGSNFHADTTTSDTTGSARNPVAVTAAISATNATDLASCLALAANIDSIYRIMIADDVAHKVADTVVPANAVPTDLTTLEAYLNDVKAKFNTHCGSTTFHYTADATNTVATADATDQTTANALANALKTKINAHITGAAAGHGIRLIGP